MKVLSIGAYEDSKDAITSGKNDAPGYKSDRTFWTHKFELRENYLLNLKNEEHGKITWTRSLLTRQHVHGESSVSLRGRRLAWV